MDRVRGKIAVVTGGALGLGAASARMLAREGAVVVVTDLKDSEGKGVVKEINDKGGKALYLHHDVSREDEWEAVIARTVEEFGRLDVLVNNAALPTARCARSRRWRNGVG